MAGADRLAARDPGRAAVSWGIIQKQTGADRLTLGGALSSNVHGRVLGRGPIVDDVVAYPHRRQRHARRCSRDENAALFRLAIGGYGLFGPSSRCASGSRRGARSVAR